MCMLGYSNFGGRGNDRSELDKSPLKSATWNRGVCLIILRLEELGMSLLNKASAFRRELDLGSVVAERSREGEKGSSIAS
jgi:hypothetical protein